MKTILALAVGVALMVTSSVSLAQKSVEQTLIDLENEWGRATDASDGKALDPLLASTFVFFGSDGTMQTKAEFVADAYKYKWQGTNATDMKVTVHGDSAVVTGVWTGKGTDPKGNPISGKQRFVDTWVKMSDGKWRCVAGANIELK